MPSSRHLVNPDYLPLLEFFPPTGFNAETLGEIRAMLAALPPVPAADDGVTITERFVPGPAGAAEVRVQILTPTRAAAPYPIVLHLHGGGYVVGTPEFAEAGNRAIASAAGCVIVSVDYRLSPEAIFPAAVEDAYAALKWAHANAAALNADPARIVVMGESAGGGLAACLALLARDRGEVPLAGQVLIYPMLDDRTTDAANAHPHAGEFVWTLANNHYAWTCLLGEPPGGPNVSPYAAPARAESLAGLPPTYIALGDLDLFLEEDLEYARRLVRVGVPTELHVYPGAPHGYPLMAEVDLTKRAAQDQLMALRRMLGT